MKFGKFNKLVDGAIASSSLSALKSIDFSEYADYPDRFALEVLEVQILTEEQKQILFSIRDRRITNVPAAHSVGKSKVSAIALLWWVFAVRGTAFSTAPSLQQVKNILWKEVRVLYDVNREKLGGNRGELFVKLDEGAKGIGFSARHNDSNSFQGRHAQKLLLIEDEADGISSTIDEAFESCLTGGENRGVRIGNPLNSQSPFAKACAISQISIPAWQHPNVSWAYVRSFERVDTKIFPEGIHRLKPEVAAVILKPERERKEDPVKPQSEWPDWCPRDVIPGAISVAWIESCRIKYDEDSVFWRSRIEAQFPDDDVQGSIITRSLLNAGRQRYDQNQQYWDDAAAPHVWRIGLDVGDGVDNHAIAFWKGPVLYRVEVHATKGDGEDVSRAAGLVSRWYRLFDGRCLIAVDNTGVGAGALAMLREQGYPARGCKFGAEAKDVQSGSREQFYNRKTELYWCFREGLRKGEFAIAPIENQDYVFEDLSATRYKLVSTGQLTCESKSETKKRLKRSPDAEAAIIALENPLQPGGVPGVEAQASYTMAHPEELELHSDLALLKRLFSTD